MAKKPVVLPSEAAQHLAQHIANQSLRDIGSYEYSWDGSDRDYEIDAQDLAEVIQKYWDSLL